MNSWIFNDERKSETRLTADNTDKRQTERQRERQRERDRKKEETNERTNGKKMRNANEASLFVDVLFHVSSRCNRTMALKKRTE
jgi:hypothetical protein